MPRTRSLESTSSAASCSGPTYQVCVCVRVHVRVRVRVRVCVHVRVRVRVRPPLDFVLAFNMLYALTMSCSTSTFAEKRQRPPPQSVLADSNPPD